MSTEEVRKDLSKVKVSKDSSKKNKKKDGDINSGKDELENVPDFVEHRIRMFEKLQKEYLEDISQRKRVAIEIRLDDDRVILGESWLTTPSSIARNIGKSFFERMVIAEVDGNLWDMERPLENSCRLRFYDFEHDKGKAVFWHSSAHLLGEAAERRFGCNLCIGPPIDDGFYYEMALPNEQVVVQGDYGPLERIAAKAISEKQVFERLELSKTDLLEMFKNNKFKLRLIESKIPDGSKTTVYRCGPMIDLCKGPHIPHMGRIKSFKIMKNSAAYFLGDAKNESLQRIYGVSFPSKAMMDEHLHYLEEAAKRDHRKIGKDQELFFFHDLSPGSCFFLPHGMIIYNNLLNFIRSEYWKRGYQEVSSPNMFNCDLWKRSGHWEHYKDDIFQLNIESELWALKPMNCPGHCLLFGHRDRSYRELPMRIADFGILHRNEASGALSGLTRVRRFVQDDTHIFCTADQIEEEMLGLFDFLQEIYGKFGFSFKLKLSTRPESYLGTPEVWDRAEAKLSAALDILKERGHGDWELNPGDGAFYGPKIDITISDALKREHQCATIQLDFNLPERFNLLYQEPDTQAKISAMKRENDTKGDSSSEKGNKPMQTCVPLGYARPVMIHRAIYGSFERFIAILTEHFAGKWPFWISPRQVLVLPVMPAVNDYVLEVVKLLRENYIHADSDTSGNTLQKKIRTGQLSSYNFIFVVGAEEKNSRTVNIRNRDDTSTQTKGDLVPLDTAISKLIQLRESRQLLNKM